MESHNGAPHTAAAVALKASCLLDVCWPSHTGQLHLPHPLGRPRPHISAWKRSQLTGQAQGVYVLLVWVQVLPLYLMADNCSQLLQGTDLQVLLSSCLCSVELPRQDICPLSACPHVGAYQYMSIVAACPAAMSCAVLALAIHHGVYRCRPLHCLRRCCLRSAAGCALRWASPWSAPASRWSGVRQDWPPCSM